MEELKKHVIELQKKYNALETKCDRSARELQNLIDMNLKAINVIQCCKSVKITEKQQNIETITALTEVVKANNKLFGSEKTMEISNSKIKELMQQL